MRIFLGFLATLAFAACSDSSEPTPDQSAADAGSAADAAHENEHEHESDPEGHLTPYPSCQAIMDLCHPLDQGRPGRIHDCHELAMDATDDTACAARREECIDVCTLGGGDPDAAAPDAK